ncbi:4Fe-4S binding protein [Clostridioides difficile]
MFKVNFRKERCKGCELCVNFCPKKLIIMDKNINGSGYYTPIISKDDEVNCVGCCSCAKICPESAISIEKI